MPTRQEEAAAVEGIQRLQNQKFSVDDEGPRPDAEGRHTWNEMTPDEHIALMNGNLEWKGFDEEQRLDVIENVLCSRQSWDWMRGVRLSPDSPSPEQSMAVARRIDELLEATFHCRDDGHPVPDPGGEDEGHHRNSVSSSTGWDTWTGLNLNERENVLRNHVDWEGFSESRVAKVVASLIVDEPRSRWRVECGLRHGDTYDPAAYARPGEPKEKSKGRDR